MFLSAKFTLFHSNLHEIQTPVQKYLTSESSCQIISSSSRFLCDEREREMAEPWDFRSEAQSSSNSSGRSSIAVVFIFLNCNLLLLELLLALAYRSGSKVKT